MHPRHTSIEPVDSLPLQMIPNMINKNLRLQKPLKWPNHAHINKLL